MAESKVEETEAPLVRKTITCFLCGGIHIYPGPRFENHLINEHGAVFDVEFLIQIALFKKENGALPDLNLLAKSKDANSIDEKEDFKIKTSTSETQTDPEESHENGFTSPTIDASEEDMDIDATNGHMNVKDIKQEVATSHHLEISSSESINREDHEDDEGMITPDIVHEDEGEMITCWFCPVCPKIFKRHSYFKQHASLAHEMELADILNISSIEMTEEEFQKQKEAEDKSEVSKKPVKLGPFGSKLKDPSTSYGGSFMVDKTKRKPIGKEWAPNSFSSTFTCYFCNEQFRKDYKLKLHLMLNHKSEDPDEMAKAKEELMKSKLDGCVHKCALCGSKYNSVANFTRHVKDSHQMTRAQYREEYGSSEIVSRTFKCELCEKEVKHTRNIIGAHMKMVHLISWKEYQDILAKLRQGEVVGDLPTPELFDCIICGVSVKYKREHLNKKHQITEDVYDQLILKKNRGEDISNAVPQRELTRCLICDRATLDFKKHIERSHQLDEAMYEEIVANKTEPAMQNNGNHLTPKYSPSPRLTPAPTVDNFQIESPAQIHAPSGTLSTDLQCYFGCDEPFKKDYQLFLHLRLKHRNESTEEIARAYEAAEEEIQLTRRSGSLFECALCDKTFNDNGAFYSHIQTKHSMKWNDYKDEYGRCETESAPFECKICSRVIKYDRNTIHTHLKNVHGINWAMYLDRIRKMRRGEVPDELPQIEMVECRVCNIQVKYLKEHLKNAHKITEQEYESLFEGDTNNIFGGPINKPNKVNNNLVSKPVTPTLPLPENLAPVPPKPPKSDIQDKTNKTCSSCTITFDSRRSFIEHCTTVHNMKFKTKSGITISAPALQQAALKRQAVDALTMSNGRAQPAPKRSKTIQTQEGTYNIEYEGQGGGVDPLAHEHQGFENQMSLQQHQPGSLADAPQYTPNGVSKWNQCQYKCCFCGKTTMSRSSMTSHVHNSHGIPIKEYKEKNYPDIEVITRWFQCRLCSARTKFVKDCIAPHLKMSHNMDIEHYEKTYMQPEDWPDPIPQNFTLKPEKTLITPTSTPKASLTFAQIKQEIASNNAAAANQSMILSSPMMPKVDKWNKCKFQCSLCDYNSMDSRQMRSHIATKHSMSHEKYVQQYGSTEVITKKFTCELCMSVTKHCRQNIYAHMKDVHKITLDEYEERIGGYDGGETTEQEVGITLMQPSYPVQNEVHPNGPLPLLDGGNTPNRWNKCQFQCAICKKLSSEKRHIRDHVVKAHDMSMADYDATYGDCEVHTEYFFCGICHAEVKHNLKNISLHLQNVHKMNSQEYEAQFGRMAEGSSATMDNAEEFGFGSHFLLDENSSESPAKPHSSFVSPAPKRTPRRGPPGGLPCDYCGKVFSTRSNKNRHMVLSCEAKKDRVGGENCDDSQEVGAVVDEDEEDESDDNEGNLQIDLESNLEGNLEENGAETPEIIEEVPAPISEDDSIIKKREHKCPYPDCGQVYHRSFLLKRHLADAHQIQSLTVKLPSLEEEQKKMSAASQIKTEPMEMEEERKVPPLRVKLSTPVAEEPVNGALNKEKTPKPTAKEPQPCGNCPYKNSNLYILGRHQKACLKKSQQLETRLEEATEVLLEEHPTEEVNDAPEETNEDEDVQQAEEVPDVPEENGESDDAKEPLETEESQVEEESSSPIRDDDDDNMEVGAEAVEEEVPEEEVPEDEVPEDEGEADNATETICQE